VAEPFFYARRSQTATNGYRFSLTTSGRFSQGADHTIDVTKLLQVAVSAAGTVRHTVLPMGQSTAKFGRDCLIRPTQNSGDLDEVEPYPRSLSVQASVTGLFASVTLQQVTAAIGAVRERKKRRSFPPE
jgi:hypothetical protein